MSTPFGPQLIGETEKALDALLRRFLDGTGLREPHWVTLRIAGTLDGRGATDGLIEAVADRAHFPDADQLVHELTDRGLLRDGRLTDAGRELTASVQRRIEAGTAQIWDELPAADVAATTRILNEVVRRARVALSSSRVRQPIGRLAG